MTDGTTPATGQAPTAGTAQVAPDTSSKDTDSGQDPKDDGDISAPASGLTDPIALQKELAKVRAEAAEYRVRLKTYEEQRKREGEASLSDAQRLEKRVVELEQEKEALSKERSELLVLNAVIAESNRLGIVDPDAAVKLLDRDALEVDDDGRPKAIDKALRDLLREKPYLTSKPVAVGKATDASAGVTAGPPPNLTSDELRAAQAAGLSPERYAALKEVRTLDDWQKLTPQKRD